MEDDYPGFFELSQNEKWFKEEAIKHTGNTINDFCKYCKNQIRQE